MFFLPDSVFNYLLKEKAKPQIEKYKDTRQMNDKCPISLNSFSPDSDVASLLCGHCFNPKCLQLWLDKQEKMARPLSCPLCRTQLKVNKKKAIQTFVKKLLLVEDKYIQQKIYTNLIYKGKEDEDEDEDVNHDLSF